VRVTHAGTSRTLLTELQQNQRRIEDAQARLVTGRRVRTVSDDPVAAAAIMRTASELRALGQYRRNVVYAEMRLAAEEHALDRLNEIMIRARELAVSQADATANEMTRAAALAEVERLIESVTQLGNTRLAGGYLFAGDAVDRPPFESTGVLAPDITGMQGVKIAPNYVVAVTHNAKQVFEDTGVLASLHRLRDALAANDAESVAQSIPELTHAFEEIQYLIGEVGAQANQLTLAGDSADALTAELTIQRSHLEDADFEAAIMEIASRQTTLQAAMLATSRILSMRLTDYIR